MAKKVCQIMEQDYEQAGGKLENLPDHKHHFHCNKKTAARLVASGEARVIAKNVIVVKRIHQTHVTGAPRLAAINYTRRG